MLFDQVVTSLSVRYLNTSTSSLPQLFYNDQVWSKAKETVELV